MPCSHRVAPTSLGWRPPRSDLDSHCGDVHRRLAIPCRGRHAVQARTRPPPRALRRAGTRRPTRAAPHRLQRRAESGHAAGSRHRARAPGESLRGGASGSHDSHAPHRQEGVAGGLAAARRVADRPHHAGGRRHARQCEAAVRKGRASGSFGSRGRARCRRPRAHGRSRLRLPRDGSNGGGRARGHWHPGGRGVHRLPRRSVADRGARA